MSTPSDLDGGFWGKPVAVGDEVPCPLCKGLGVVATAGVAPVAIICRGCDGKRFVIVVAE